MAVLRIRDVFYTTDYGLIFIDSTGTTHLEGIGEDKVAYVEIGKEYGLIPIDMVDCFDYACYIDYKSRWEEYNNEVQAYNQALGGRESLPEPEYSYFMNWHNRLEKERASLGEYWYEPLGIVSEIEIYWNSMKWEEVGVK